MQLKRSRQGSGPCRSFGGLGSPQQALHAMVLLRRVVGLGGLAATTQFCRTQDDNVDPGAPPLPSNITVGGQVINIGRSVSCAQQYQASSWT